MPDISPTSVTLKINKTSVMLYANRYLKLPDQGGATVQAYLGSFPVTACEVPAKFEALLRGATEGRPERYQALMRRITDDVIVPARLEKEREEIHRRRLAIGNALRWARKNLAELPEMPFYATHIGSPELQSLLKDLHGEFDHLAADIALPEQATPEDKSNESKKVAEEKLQRLLETVELACAEIVALMPEATKAFKRSYVFQPQTLAQVQRLWFRTSDAVAALSARRQLRRPRLWGTLRAKVLADTKDTEDACD